MNRWEARCSRCGLIEVIEDSDAPGQMSAETYARFEANGHAADCLGTISVELSVDVEAETTKYDTGEVDL